jgi:glycosyltransferase involved in cell wall biosynthesis
MAEIVPGGDLRNTKDSAFGTLRGLVPASLHVSGSGVVIIPCYNHTEHLNSVVSEVRATVPDLPVIVVDDGSKPPVPPIAGVQVIAHRVNRGKGAAILTGINHAQDCEYVVLVDADGQHPAGEIPAMLAALEAPPKADLVTSSRDLVHDHSIPIRHRVANLLLSMEFAILNGRFLPDITNGFRVIRVRSLLAVDMRFHRYEVEIETLRAMLRHNMVVRCVLTRGVRYESVSSIGRGFRITATLALSMLASKVMNRTNGHSAQHKNPVTTS